MTSGEASPAFGHADAIFSVFMDRMIKESISKEVNSDNNLNLHSMTKLSGWLDTSRDSKLNVQSIV